MPIVKICPKCHWQIEYWGFSGNPFCPKCYKYVEPLDRDISDKTAYDSYLLAQKMWADKLLEEDLFDFVRIMLNELYKLATEKEV